MTDLQIINYKGEKIVQCALFGENRSKEVVDYQLKVFEKFGYPINQFLCPMPTRSYGNCLDEVMSKIHEKVDYTIFWDIDSIPLMSNYLETFYNLLRNKNTVCGGAFRNAHKKKDSNWPFDFVSCGPPFGISTELYLRLGKPTMDHHLERSDTFEEISFRAKEAGAIVAIFYPSHVGGKTDQEPEKTVEELEPPLEAGIKFGYSCTYANFVYHQFNATCNSHVEKFVNKCKQILGE